MVLDIFCQHLWNVLFMYCILLFNNDMDINCQHLGIICQLSPQELVHMGTCPPGTCPEGSCHIWNLSGGKLSPQEFVHMGTCPGGTCLGGKLSRGKLSVSRRRLADNFPLVCLERGKQQQQSNKWKKNYSILSGGDTSTR